MHCMTYITKTSGDNHTYIGWKPILDGSGQGSLCFRRVHTSHAKADGSNSFPGFATTSKGRCNCAEDQVDHSVSSCVHACMLSRRCNICSGACHIWQTDYHEREGLQLILTVTLCSGKRTCCAQKLSARIHTRYCLFERL